MTTKMRKSLKLKFMLKQIKTGALLRFLTKIRIIHDISNKFSEYFYGKIQTIQRVDIRLSESYQIYAFLSILTSISLPFSL